MSSLWAAWARGPMAPAQVLRRPLSPWAAAPEPRYQGPAAPALVPREPAGSVPGQAATSSSPGVTASSTRCAAIWMRCADSAIARRACSPPPAQTAR